MTDQRHHAHKHPKVTTTQQDSGSLCTCAFRTQWSDCIRDGFDGGRGNALVRGEQHLGARRYLGKVPGGEDVAVVRQLQHDPHNREHMRDEWCFANVGQHCSNGAPSPTSLNPTSVKRRNTIPTHNNHNSISGDALLLYIARNSLLARLAPFLGSFTNTQSKFGVRNKTKTMDVIVPHKKHRTRTEEDESAGRHRHHRRHHRNGHKSDGELEKERMRAKIRGGEKGRTTSAHMERSSSDRGKVKEKASASSSERTKRVETDEEREERRRRRRERREAEAPTAARVDTDPILSDSYRGHRSHRRDSERRSSRKENRYESDREGNLSPRSDRDKQLILARKEKESSKVSTRETLRPHVSSSSRRAESKQHVRESSEKSSEKEKGKESSSEMEKKDKMVKCVSCFSDDIPAHQAAKLACNHQFCDECLKRIFTLSLTDPALMPPKCCTTEHIPLKHAERLLSHKTKKQWNRKYSEYTSSNRVYCPTKDCGHWISPKHIEAKIGTCSRCKTKVCTMCNGKAHEQSECPQDEDTKVFIQTAKENGYQRCYECKAVVELKSGCNHITCRCTAEFCYRCGDKWKTCDCPWFAYPDSEEGEDEQDDQAAPARLEEENAEARRERRRREQMERERREQEERRHREAQIAEDEALARRLAQASLFLDKEMLEKLDGSGSLRAGLRNSYKKLSEEYAEASKRDEEARGERVRDRLQKLRDRDEAIRSARRGSTSSHREPRSPTVRHERRHSEPRPLTSRGLHSRPKTAQPSPTSPSTRENPEDDSAHRGLFDDERAARIAKYIMGELDELDDAPTVQLPSPIEKPAGSSSPRHRPHVERVRRATLSAVEPRASSRKPAEYGRDGRPSHHHTNKAASVLPRTLPRLETSSYAASSVLADVSFPLENEKPNRRSSSHTRAGKIRDIYINTSAKSAPTSPMHSTPTSALDSTSSRRGYLADLGYKFLKHHQQVPAPYSAYPLNYTSAVAPAPTYTTYAYNSYTGFGAGEGSRARQFTQNWGGVEAVGGSSWNADRLELASHAPRVGISRTSTY